MPHIEQSMTQSHVQQVQAVAVPRRVIRANACAPARPNVPAIPPPLVIR